jgi:type IV fimbrial biogenesis protein FimT
MAVGFRNRHGNGASARGFGLVELMTVVAIVAVLTAIALPSYAHVMKLNRLTTDANNMMAAMNLARNEAITRGRPVSVCASTNGTACTGAATDDWSGGWIVFTDYDPAGAVDAGVGDEVLRVFGPVAQKIALNSHGANIGYVRFGRTGSATFPAAGTSATFYATTAPCEAGYVRKLTVRALGRTATEAQDTCP